MVWIVLHAVLGVGVIWVVVRSNPAVLRRPAEGPWLSPLEWTWVVVGVASWVAGYAFNIAFVREYAVPGGNPIWGPGSWQDYIQHLFTNPAAGSASEDYIFVNVVLLPVFTIVEGRRRGIARPWLFFVSSLFTSCTFGLCLYFAVAERLRRLGLGHDTAAHEVAAVQPVGGPNRT